MHLSFFIFSENGIVAIPQNDANNYFFVSTFKFFLVHIYDHNVIIITNEWSASVIVDI